jgi:hypothetical protein
MAASTLSMFAGGLVAVMLLGALALAGAYMLYRYALRRWRVMRNHVAMRSALATWDGVRALGNRRSLRGGSAAWSSTKTRREMWRAVGAADQALAHAAEVGASTGDLVSLNRRLHTSAAELDRLVALDPGGGALRPHVDQLLTAASDIRLAAVNAAGDVAAPGVQSLAADAEREFRAIAEGLARSRAAVSAPR